MSSQRAAVPAGRPSSRSAVLLVLVVLGLLAGLVTAVQARAGEAPHKPAHGLPVGVSAAASYPTAVPGQVIVQMRSGLSIDSVDALAETLGAGAPRDLGVSSRLLGGGRLLLFTSGKLDGPALEAAALSDPSVVAASLNYIRTAAGITPNDPQYPQMWGLDNRGQTGGTPGADISAPEGWSMTTGGSGIVVADLDTGVDYAHADLAAAMWHNPGEIPDNGLDDDDNGYVDDHYGIDAVNDDCDPWDDNGHGTHTSGTVAATGNNGVGVTGVAWQAKIMALKFLGADGMGDDASAISCIYYAILEKTSHGVNVVAINASWGGGGYDPLLRNAINSAGANGIVFCVAAGNGGTDNDVRPYYPASYDCANLISVAATDHTDALALWTSGGGSNWGAVGVDLAAPGKSILSTIAGRTVAMLPEGPFYDTMEAGSSGWTAQTPWAITQEQAVSPTHAWSDSPGANYPDNADVSITTRAIDLSTLPGPTAFGGQVRWDLERGYDFLRLEFSADDGLTWRTMTSITGSSTNLFQPVFARIPADMRVSTFKARFRLQSDASVGADGVYVDDVGFADFLPLDQYGAWSGTSMATPHVTGAVALAATLFPGETAKARVKRVLASVDALPALSGKCVTGGRLNLAKLLLPRLSFTAPLAGWGWPSGSTQAVSWKLTGPVPSGEFRVWLVSAGGGWFVNKQVLPVAGATSYSTNVAVSCPAGAGYRAYVYWRPTVGSGAWVVQGRSGAFTVTPVNITSPMASSVWPLGSSQTITWTINPTVATGEFKVWLVSAGGAWYFGRTVAAVGTQTGYTCPVTVSGTGMTTGTYKPYVYYRPTVGSGSWTIQTIGAAFSVIM